MPTFVRDTLHHGAGGCAIVMVGYAVGSIASGAVLARLASLTAEHAKQVVDAVEQGIRDEAFDTIAGTGPVPSAMTDARAARLHYIARRLGRPLRRREVEVVFRIPPSTARAVVGR